MKNQHTASTAGAHSSPESILVHMAVLRRAVIRYMVVLISCFGMAMAFHGTLMQILQYPLRRIGYPQELGFIEITEPFMVSLRVAMLGAALASSPWLFYEIWRFIAPALYRMERGHVRLLMVAAWGLFGLGVMSCFFVIMPLALDFLVTYGQDFAAPNLTLRSYVAFLSTLLIGFGLIFELPLVLVVLAMLGLISAAGLRQARRYVLLGAFVCAALLTPPDWISQVGMAVPIYGLYELAIIIISRLERRGLVSGVPAGGEQDGGAGVVD